MAADERFAFWEFFAGGGMARAGLGSERWRCRFANDLDRKKARTYALNWGDTVLKVGDVAKLSPDDLTHRADLVWASFPCQDLSLAGGGAGLQGERSGTFWPFWELMRAVAADGGAPALIALENVCGAVSSHGGRDFAALCEAFVGLGYRIGALVIDAALFVPQSRPRLFLVGARSDVPIPETLRDDDPSPLWHTRALRAAWASLPHRAREGWVWWRLPLPPERHTTLADLLEDDPTDAPWRDAAATEALLAIMAPLHRARIERAKAEQSRSVGCVYKRTRRGAHGSTVRAEVRFDHLAGCLRTPAGGSSRQSIVVTNGGELKSRLLSARETARLMGLPDDYALPSNYNEAYHLTGDGVVVPVVGHLSNFLFLPLLGNHRRSLLDAA